MRHRVSIAAVALAALTASSSLPAQSIEDCQARANWAKEQTEGALAGAAKGALGGAAVGVLLGRSTGAKRGAALGAVVNGARKSGDKQDAYNEEFARCMQEREDKMQ